jgi:hypothetical protein
MRFKKATTQQISMTDVRAIWEELMREQSHRTGYRQLHDVTSAKCYLGYTPQTGTRFVQLDIPASVAHHAAMVRRTQAIRLERVHASDEEHVILLLLQEPGLTDVFSLFIDDLLQHLVLTHDAEQAVSTIYSRFEHWQQLFARITSDVIGLERQRGLFGELTILKELLDRHADAPEIWDCWRGPFSANHDFSMSGTAMEVKASAASLPIMRISSEVQLDLVGWHQVVLCLVHLNEVRGGSQTLTELIQALLERSSRVASVDLAFRSKLLKVGVDASHYELFTELGYSVRSIQCFNVTQDFPAIRRSVLCNAIGKVTYELHPAGCATYGMALEDAMALFQPL